MDPITLSERSTLCEKLIALKSAVAEEVTNEFFRRHPDWLERYGDLGRKRGIEDACFHVDFLAGAIESGSTAPFEDYIRWVVRMLAARRISAPFITENLEQIENALSPRLSAREHQFVISFIRAGCDVCKAAPAQASTAEHQTGLGLSRSLFLQAIVKGQRKAASTVVSEALREGHPVLDIYVEVLQESLYRVGRLWESNELTVAEEHMATAITQYVIAQTYSHLPATPIRRGNLVLTGVAGELHQVGANMVADALESQGYDVRFLGTNMPTPGILQEIENHHADTLGISATMLFNIPAVVRLIEDVRVKFGSLAPRIVLGGAAFRSVPSLGAELETVGIAADLRGAVKLLCV